MKKAPIHQAADKVFVSDFMAIIKGQSQILLLSREKK